MVTSVWWKTVSWGRCLGLVNTTKAVYGYISVVKNSLVRQMPYLNTTKAVYGYISVVKKSLEAGALP